MDQPYAVPVWNSVSPDGSCSQRQRGHSGDLPTWEGKPAAQLEVAEGHLEVTGPREGNATPSRCPAASLLPSDTQGNRLITGCNCKVARGRSWLKSWGLSFACSPGPGLGAQGQEGRPGLDLGSASGGGTGTGGKPCLHHLLLQVHQGHPHGFPCPRGRDGTDPTHSHAPGTQCHSRSDP